MISRPAASARPKPESGRSSAARRAARPSAVPDTIVSRQPRFRQVHERAVDVDDHVPNSPPRRGAAHQLAADDDAAADPRPERQQRRVGAPRAAP